MTSKNWTLLYSIAGEPVELYNRETDLAQEDNVFLRQTEVATELHKRFNDFLESLDTEEVSLGPRHSLE